MSNPFSSRFIRPGATEFIFPDGLSAAVLLARLREQQWTGEIVGPHGSGKSTLLATLLPLLEAERMPIVNLTLHDGQRRLPTSFADLANVGGAGPRLIVVDGYEQLSRWSRWRLERWRRRRDCGLLVTSHAPTGLPLLLRTVATAELAERVVQRLLPAGDRLVTTADVRNCFTEQHGNVREALFALYRLYEQRRRVALPDFAPAPSARSS